MNRCADGVAGDGDGAVAGAEGEGVQEVVVEEGGGGYAHDGIEAVAEGDEGARRGQAVYVVDTDCGVGVGEEEEEENGEGGEESEHGRWDLGECCGSVQWPKFCVRLSASGRSRDAGALTVIEFTVSGRRLD